MAEKKAGTAKPEGYPSITDMLTEAKQMSKEVIEEAESGTYKLWTECDLSLIHISVGHAGKTPVLQMITGPAVLVDSVTFRIQWNRGTLWTDKKSDIVFSCLLYTSP